MDLKEAKKIVDAADMTKDWLSDDPDANNLNKNLLSSLDIEDKDIAILLSYESER